MPLQVAPCPVCKNALVFGEKVCRQCGQTFQYGARAPSEPSAAEIVEALQAAGLAPPQELVRAAQQQQQQRAPQRAAAPQRAPAPAGLEGLDRGRFSVGEVEITDVPGLMDSGIFAAMTPKDVHAPPVAGLDTGRFEVGEVRVAPVAVEQTAQADAGEVFAIPVSGVFHSDFLKAPGPVHSAPVEGLEASPSGGTRSTKDAAAAPKPARAGDPLPLILCRCGEKHRLPRCLACGTAHPGAAP